MRAEPHRRNPKLFVGILVEYVPRTTGVVLALEVGVHGHDERGFMRGAEEDGNRGNTVSLKKVSHRLQSFGTIGNNQTKVPTQKENVLEELFPIYPRLGREHGEAHQHDLLVGVT